PFSAVQQGNFRFQANPNAFSNPPGSVYTTFTFRLRDTGGTANGGQDTELPPGHTQSIIVLPVNDPPSGSDKSITLPEDSPGVNFSETDFGFGDATDNPLPNQFQDVIITTLPVATNGTLTFAGSPVTPSQAIPKDQLGSLLFKPALNKNSSQTPTPVFNFGFKVRDNGGVDPAHNGSDTDPTENFITFTVTPVNDPPVGANGSVATLQDLNYTFASND